MSTVLNQIVIWGSVVVTVYGAIAAFLVFRAILKDRNESYRAKYEEFLSQKRRIQNRLKSREKDGE